MRPHVSLVEDYLAAVMPGLTALRLARLDLGDSTRFSSKAQISSCDSVKRVVFTAFQSYLAVTGFEIEFKMVLVAVLILLVLVLSSEGRSV